MSGPGPSTRRADLSPRGIWPSCWRGSGSRPSKFAKAPPRAKGIYGQTSPTPSAATCRPCRPNPARQEGAAEIAEARRGRRGSGSEESQILRPLAPCRMLMTSPAASQSAGQRAPDVLNPPEMSSLFRLRSPPEIDACVQSPAGGSPRGTFRIARAPSAQHIGHVSNVSRADDPDEGSLAEERPPDRVGDARSSGEGGLSKSLGLATPPALFGQRLADTAGVISPELLSETIRPAARKSSDPGWRQPGAAPAPACALASASPPRTSRTADTASREWSAVSRRGWGDTESRTARWITLATRARVQRPVG